MYAISLLFFFGGLSLLLSTFASPALPTSTGTLHRVQIIEVCRHGDRAPIALYPKDPAFFVPTSSWSFGLGQLSPHGMAQHFSVGQHVRHSYLDGVLSSYQYGKMYVRSTDVSRCLMSAQAQLLGILNGTGPLDDVVDPSVAALPHRFQPVPIHTVSTKEDILLRGASKANSCPRLKQLMDANYQSSEAKKFMQGWSGFIKFLVGITGLTDTYLTDYYGTPTSLDLKSIGKAFTPMLCSQIHQIPLPGVDPDVVNQGKVLHDYSMYIRYSGENVHRLTSGNLLYELSNQLQQNKYEFILYSSHDSTVSALLHALGLSQLALQAPPYASYIILELYEDGTMTPPPQYVKLTYENGSQTEISQPLCGGKVICPLEEFVQGISHLFVRNYDEWDKLCRTTISHKYQNDQLSLAIVGIPLILLLGMLVFVFRRRIAFHTRNTYISLMQ
jgi:testicular acid phosphatase